MESNDHDLLIKVSTCVEQIKKQLDRHCDAEDQIVTKTIWMWVTGLIFTMIFGAFLYTTAVGSELHKHETNAAIHSIDEDN